MAGTVIEYLQKYGDISFREKPLNDVDSLALCQLSYLKFDGMVSDVRHNGPSVTLREIAERPDVDKLFGDVRFEKENRALFEGMLSGRRFRDMKLNCYINLVEKEWETQFSAITFILDDGTLFLAFRGTDETIVGWKEDFNMAFTCPVPAQRLAAHYAASAMLRFPGEFLLGGHSKGGNLAVYAAAFCPAALQERIAAVYNNDGPGFDADVIALPGYQRICARVQTFVPQSSIVGMLLEHEEAYTIIHSTGDGFGQHNLYTWEVLRDRFVTLETVTNGSRFLDRTLKQWLAGLEPEQRERTIDTVYHMLCETNAETLHELKENRFSRALALLRSAKGLDEDTRKLLVHAAGVFFRSAGRSLKQARVPDDEKTTEAG